MAEYVNVRIKKETYEKLKAQAGATPMTQFFDSIANQNADALLEQLDKQHDEWHVDPLIKDLGPDELPECCQTIYDDPTSHCEHWEDRRPVGYWNKLTHKWANDPDYIQYV